MSIASKHIIKQTVLDFRYNGNADGFVFQLEVKEWFDEFSPVLEQTLNSFTSNDEVIYVDQLEIEIDLKADDWKEQATQKIGRQFKDKLNLLNFVAVQSGSLQKKSHDQQFRDLFLFYLQKGYLSWEISGMSSSQWEEEIQHLISAADKEFATRLKDILSSSASAAQRLSQIIPFRSSVHLLSLLRKNNSVSQQQLLHDVLLLMKYAVTNLLNQLKQMVYQVYLQSVIAEGNLAKVKDDIMQLFIRESAANPQVNIMESFISFDLQSDLFKRIQTELPDAVQNRLKGGGKPKAKSVTAVEGKEIRVDADKKFDNEIYISDAGLVLIAAFLPALFKKTKLAVDHKITDLDKAICLTHFLATGIEKMNEFELPLSKILCGMELNQVADASAFQLHADLRNEAGALLTSVIEYWGILKNTSVNGLRESFLVRNGKLSYDGRDWLLQVEQRSYDMLLEHLPWSYSIIKLPWMDALLKTEWAF